jgi:hypothetical protein
MEMEMKKDYITPAIQSLGTVTELTAEENGNGCTTHGTGQGQQKSVLLETDGFENAKTGCVVS